MAPDALLAVETPGDPEAMRAVARSWSARAEQLSELAGVIAATGGELGIEGPAAQRLVEQCDAARQAAGTCAADLQALASRLLAGATEAEELQAQAKLDAEAEAAAGAVPGGEVPGAPGGVPPEGPAEAVE